MSESDFKNAQYAFCLNIREQKICSLPVGLTKEKMNLYQSLLFKNINSIVAPCFPVMRKIISTKQWEILMKGFLKQMIGGSPLFHQVSRDFVRYLATLDSKTMAFPFIAELAHYEWLELYVELLDEDISSFITPFRPNLLEEAMRLSPLACLQHYHFEVDKIGLNYLPTEKSPFVVVVYRTVGDKVKFMRLNQLTTALIDTVDRQELSLYQALEVIYEELSITMSFDSFFSHGVGALKQLINQQILILNE